MTLTEESLRALTVLAGVVLTQDDLSSTHSEITRIAVQAVPVAEALKAAGAERIYLAGRPGEQREAYLQAGVDEFVFAGSDAVAILTFALDRMGVA